MPPRNLLSPSRRRRAFIHQRLRAPGEPVDGIFDLSAAHRPRNAPKPLPRSALRWPSARSASDMASGDARTRRAALGQELAELLGKVSSDPRTHASSLHAWLGCCAGRCGRRVPVALARSRSRSFCRSKRAIDRLAVADLLISLLQQRIRRRRVPLMGQAVSSSGDGRALRGRLERAPAANRAASDASADRQLPVSCSVWQGSRPSG